MEPNQAQEEIKQALINNETKEKVKVNEIVWVYLFYSILSCSVVYYSAKIYDNELYNSLSTYINYLSLSFLCFLFLTDVWFSYKNDKQKSREYFKAFKISVIIAIVLYIVIGFLGLGFTKFGEM